MTSKQQIQCYWAAGILGGLFGLIFFLNILPGAWRAIKKPDHEDIRSYIHEMADEHDLNPDFVLAIAMAESSLNPKADAGYARGLMQMSKVAWETVEPDSSWRKAYNWQDNIDAGTAYLAYIREELKNDGHFSYPLLAASYRYGINKVRRANYRISNLPPPKNDIYREIFAGKIPKIELPNT